MSSARKLNEAKHLVNSNHPEIEALRPSYHSLHDSERTAAFESLGAMPSPEAARELISLYHDCQWRSDRLQIIHALGKNPHQRSLEFLFKKALEQQDLPIAEAAIWSLGQTHHRLAAAFLVHLYGNCNELMKPSIVGALGQIPDHTLLAQFLKDLPPALKELKHTWARNLILTLGELKSKAVLPILHDLAIQNIHPDLKLGALVSIGKMARDPLLIAPLENYFQNDLFQYHLFTSVKTQVQFRSQWTLEDYLNKLFESPQIHRTLPLELNSFNPTDVKEGLKLYSDSKYFDRLCFALSKLDFPDISEWYAEFFNFKTLDSNQMEVVFKSMSNHLDSRISKPLSHALQEKPECWQAWLSAVCLSLPTAEAELKRFFTSTLFKELTPELRTTAINELSNYGLCVQSNSALLHGVGKILDILLTMDPSPQIKSRILRALGSLGLHSSKALDVVKETLKSFPAKNPIPELTSSCFQFLRLCPEKNLTSLLLLALEAPSEGGKKDNFPIPPLFRTAYLNTLKELPTLPSPHPKLDLFVAFCLKPTAPQETQLAALGLLQNHPRRGLLAELQSCLKGEEPVQLAAIIALKTIGNEDTAELLIKFLESKQKSHSGRALDTLTALPGLRAKRIVIDYLTDHSEDSDVCDKVIRCFTPPELSSDYFQRRIDEILKKSPLHPQKEGLLLLREKVSLVRSPLSHDGVKAKGMNIQAIDQELEQKINGYLNFDEAVKSTLRSAELTHKHRELFDEYVDKASSIVGYCKSVDLLMERCFGKGLLFPKLEKSPHEFQNVLYAIGLNESHPHPEHVLTQLELESYFSPQSLPVHKMGLIAQSIFNGKIVNEHFKPLDGLRAWSVMLLLFARKYQNRKPILSLKAPSDDVVVNLAKRLIVLQDIRNPLAHRQTVLKFIEMDEVRKEVFALLSLIPKVISG